MEDWKKYYFRLEEGLGLVFIVLLGLGGLAYAIITFGFVRTAIFYALLVAAIVLAARILS